MKNTPVFQFYAKDPWRFLLSRKEHIGSGWTQLGIAFQAFEEPINTESNIIPIYQHKAEDPWRFLYSKREYVGSGWTNDGTAFYAFESTKPGAIAIYQHKAEDPWRFVYAKEEHVGSGWTNDGIAFYALPVIKYFFNVLELRYDDDAVDPSKFVKRRSLGINEELRNPSDIGYVRELRFKKELESHFEWGLDASLHYGSEISCKAGVPAVGEFSGKLSFDLTLSAYTKSSKKETSTYDIFHMVHVPSRTAVAIDIVVDWLENCPYPFQLKVQCTARAGREDLNRDQLKELLPLIGCTGEYEDSKKENAVNVLLKGEFICSMGMKSSYEQRNIPIEAADD